MAEGGDQAACGEFFLYKEEISQGYAQAGHSGLEGGVVHFKYLAPFQGEVFHIHLVCPGLPFAQVGVVVQEHVVFEVGGSF